MGHFDSRSPDGGGRVMALDPGRKRIGAAISDESGSLAFPLGTVTAAPASAALEGILELIREHRPARLVVGHPLNMDGTRGLQAEQSEKFAERLAAASSLPVDLWDERLTTAWAERSLIEQNVRRRRRREVRDQAAAVILLQGYLDHRRAGGRT